MMVLGVVEKEPAEETEQHMAFPLNILMSPFFQQEVIPAELLLLLQRSPGYL